MNTQPSQISALVQLQRGMIGLDRRMGRLENTLNRLGVLIECVHTQVHGISSHSESDSDEDPHPGLDPSIQLAQSAPAG